MDTKILEDLGLKNSEIKIYLCLLQNPKIKAGEIIKKTNLASSAVYNSLNSLLEKGIIQYNNHGVSKQYSALSPKLILDYIDNKKTEFLNVLPDLEKRYNKSDENYSVQIFAGYKGLFFMLNQVLKESRENDEFLFFSANSPSQNKELQDFFTKYDAKRIEKKLDIKGIANKSLKQYYEKRQIYKYIKLVPFVVPEGLSMCKDYTMIIAYEDKPISILIKSKQITKMYKQFFYQLWNMKKV